MRKHPPRRYFKDSALLINIGGRIREIRQNKNVSQEMLANECEIDYSQVNRMELGKVNFSISYLYKVAGALGVNPKSCCPKKQNLSFSLYLQVESKTYLKST